MQMSTLLHKLIHRAKFVGYKLLHRAYYKLLFNRHFPSERFVSTAIHTLERKWKRGDIPVSQEVWEAQYASGRWKYMRELEELPRYSIVAGYFQHFKPGGALLDVGCGEGILLERLGQLGYSKYVGIDISETAIRQASKRKDEKTLFVCDNVLNYIPTELFDAIVFNETLYYFDNPFQVVEKYKHYLKHHGIMITCMYVNSERAASVWRRLKTSYVSLDEVKASNKAKTWIFNVFLNAGMAMNDR